MTATPSPDAPPTTIMTDEEYRVLRASAAQWAGTSVLITDGRDRILIQRVDYRTTCLLPGGAPEPPDRGNKLVTLRREVREEAAAEFGELLFLGHLPDPDKPYSRLRYAAPLYARHPSTRPPAAPTSGSWPHPEHALELFDWGPPAADQLAAVHRPSAARDPRCRAAAPHRTAGRHRPHHLVAHPRPISKQGLA